MSMRCVGRMMPNLCLAGRLGHPQSTILQRTRNSIYVIPPQLWIIPAYEENDPGCTTSLTLFTRTKNHSKVYSPGSVRGYYCPKLLCHEPTRVGIPRGRLTTGGHPILCFTESTTPSERNRPVSTMEGVLNPRVAGRFITENSKDVWIKDEGVRKLAVLLYDKAKSGDFSVKMWRQHELNPQTMDEAAVDWVFVSAVLNFSFWSEKETEKYIVEYKGKNHSGYWALCAAMNRAIDEGFKITSPSYYASLDIKTLQKIFRSDSEFDIPLLEERARVLNEAGKVLMEKYNGSFSNVIKEADKSAQSLLKLVVNNFPSFQDVAEYNGKKVGIFKRAQILIGDIWGSCEGNGLGEFHDIDTITMFADYRIPQALVYFGVLEYSESLMEKLKQGYLFKSGEKLEVEIRGVSLWACELVRDEILQLKEKDPESKKELDVNAILIDHYLWDTRRDLADKMTDIPFHRCRGIYY